MGSRVLLAATIVTLHLLGLPSSGLTIPEQNCGIVDDELVCDDDWEEPGGQGSGGTGSGGATATGSTGTGSGSGGDDPLVEWNSAVVGFHSPGIRVLCETDDGDIGLTVRDTLTHVGTGAILYDEIRCMSVGVDDPESEPSEPPEPPAPPSREEVLDAAPIPDLAIAASPAGRGLTGLESWFWVPAPDPVTASTTLRGWTVSGSLSPTRWVWSTGDGGRYVTSGSGSVDEPAVRHTFESSLDSWSVEVAVAWEGSWSISGYGTEFTIDDLAADTVASLDYLVIQERGVLDVPGAN